MAEKISKRGGARVGAGRPRSDDPRRPLGTKVNTPTRVKLKKLAEDSDNSQIAVLEYIINKTKKVPKL